MVTVKINLYEFNELEEQAQLEAISILMDYINTIPFGGDDLDDCLDIDNEGDRNIIIEHILANAYLFYKDGSLASCTTYTGKHPRAGITEFRLNGETYNII